MGTPFSDVFEMFRVVCTDYKLDSIKKIDEEAFYTILKSIMLTGLPQFDCLKSLAYVSQEEIIDGETVTRYYFVEVLDIDEIMIISKITAETWFRGKILDTRAFQPFMSQREFKKESVNENLKRKEDYQKFLITDYMGDIRTYYNKHTSSLDFWGEL